MKMTRAKPTPTLRTLGAKLSKFLGDPLTDPTKYRSMVEAFQYLTLTKLDISYSVNQLCQFLHCFTNTHLTATKRVLRYLKGTLQFELQFNKGSLQLNGFCDSYWVGNPDDRKSTSGYYIYLGLCLISWTAKKQSVVTRSSTEAEYRSMTHTVAELYWLRMLLKELHISLLTTRCI